MLNLIENASNTQLLNQVIQNAIPEFTNKVEHRNTFVEDGNIARWVDGRVPTDMPKKVTLRKASEKEVAIWEAYVKMVSALHMEEKV